MAPSLPHLLNQSPEFAHGQPQEPAPLLDTRTEQPDPQAVELSEIAAVDALGAAFARVFGGVWFPRKS